MSQNDDNRGQTDDSWTVLRIMRWTQGFFAEKNIENARRDAEVLLGHTLGLSRVQLFTQFDRPLTDEERDAFKAVIRRRVNHEPVAYIVGEREFWSLPIKVDRRVLIPRPDTECLVENARTRAFAMVGDPRYDAFRPTEVEEPDEPAQVEVSAPDAELHVEPIEEVRDSGLDLEEELAQEAEAAAEELPTVEPTEEAPDRDEGPWKAPRQLRVADIGTGSGAIALALAKELPYAKILATDLSADALALARENADHLGLADQITFAEGDLLAPLREGALGDGPFDLIVSNPPYIPEGQIKELMPDVANHEPVHALTPGPTGLEALERLAEGAYELLRPGGYLLCEIGYDQAEAVKEVFEKAGPAWREVKVHRDPYSGQQRVVEGRR